LTTAGGASPTATVLMATIGGESLAVVIGALLGDPATHEVVVVVDKPELAVEAAFGPLLSDRRLRVLRNERNIGLTRSLNRGIAAATGDVIVRNDDDDHPAADRVSRLVRRFAERPDVDILYSHATGRDPESGREWRIGGPTDDAGIKAALGRRNFIVHSSLAFRKTSLAPIGFYDETFRYAQDYDLYLRAIRAGLVFDGIEEPLVRRDYTSRSITVSRRRQQILNSFAARLLHDAAAPTSSGIIRTVGGYARLLMIPDWARALRRRIGYGR
jgi:glycosyltransferase involved in cell wall biosynthesis